MNFNLFSTLFLSLILSFNALYAQNIVWTAQTDSVVNFSSPRTADLNGDGILDIVTGGGLEDFARTQGILAFDGATGEILWQTPARDEVYTSATFIDVNNDQIPDVCMGGRRAQFKMLNGTNGSLIWEYFPEGDTLDPATVGLYNFYTPQLIPDQDNDGLQDLLVANGGDKFASIFDTIRPPGQLMVIGSTDGSLIAQAQVPDERETYMSPVIHDFLGDGTLSILYGTGGETIKGSFWRTALSDLLAGDISNSVELLQGNTKGFIPPPSLADVNADGIKDIIVNAYDGIIAAINGANNEIIWQLEVPQGESFSSPAIGRFTDDFVPDLFTVYGIGLAPTFTHFIAYMIDGANGEIMQSDTLPGWSMIAPLAFDYDVDGYDEALLITNSPFSQGPPFTHTLRLMDWNDNVQTDIVTDEGAILGATPWVGDLNANDTLDLVYTCDADPTIPKSGNGYIVKRLQMNGAKPQNLAWGAYMGTQYTGIHDNPYTDCISFQMQLNLTSPSCANVSDGVVGIHLLNGTPPYTLHSWTGGVIGPTNTALFSFGSLNGGTYPIKVEDGNGCIINKTAQLASPDAIALEATITPESSSGALDGSIALTASGGAGSFSFSWEFDPSLNDATANNLSSGDYVVAVFDVMGCVKIDTFTVGLATGLETGGGFPDGAKVYPIPAENQLYVALPSGIASQSAELQLFDLWGRKLKQWQFEGNHKLSANIEDLSAGFYVLALELNGEKYHSKISIK